MCVCVCVSASLVQNLRENCFYRPNRLPLPLSLLKKFSTRLFFVQGGAQRSKKRPQIVAAAPTPCPGSNGLDGFRKYIEHEFVSNYVYNLSEN